jgi:hypothetical protein
MMAEIDEASEKLMAWLESQKIDPPQAIIVLAGVIRVAIQLIADGDRKAEKTFKAMVVDLIHDKPSPPQPKNHHDGVAEELIKQAVRPTTVQDILQQAIRRPSHD